MNVWFNLFVNSVNSIINVKKDVCNICKREISDYYEVSCVVCNTCNHYLCYKAKAGRKYGLCYNCNNDDCQIIKIKTLKCSVFSLLSLFE